MRKSSPLDSPAGFIERVGQQSFDWSEKPAKAESEEHDFLLGIGHLFATGSGPGNAQIIHVAGVQYCVDRNARARDWILNPGTGITKRLYSKTGVSNADCQRGPTWSEARAEIASFFAELDVLFVFDVYHQAMWFEYVVLRGVENPPVCVDLKEMRQFFMPGASVVCTESDIANLALAVSRKKGRHRLFDVINGLQVTLSNILTVLLESASPGAAKDQPVLFHLLVDALEASHAPLDFEALCKVAARAHRISWDVEQAKLRYSRPPTVSEDSLQTFVKNSTGHQATNRPSLESVDADAAVKPIRAKVIEQIFHTLPKAVGYFEERPEQLDFARFCAKAINDGGIFAAEAGTGTGKTLGYLVPSFEFARVNRHRQVVIASGTKNLMDQILNKELPTRFEILEGLYRDLDVATLKGRGNYLCESALVRLYAESAYQQGDSLARLAWLYIFLVLRRNAGRWEAAPRDFRRRFPEINAFSSQVNASAVCFKNVCSKGDSCVYPSVLQRARQANIVITNHHKLATLDPEICSRASVCIVDEADQLPDNFRGAKSEELTKGEIIDYVTRVVGSRARRGFALVLQDQVAIDEESGSSDTILKCIEVIRTRCDAIVGCANSLVLSSRDRAELCWDDLSHGQRQTLAEALIGFLGEFEELVRQWDSILKSGRYDPANNPPESVLEEERRIRAFKMAATDFGEIVESIPAGYPSEDSVHVFSQQRGFWTLKRIPFEIGSDVTNVFGEIHATVYTSAALYVDDNLDLFGRELCLTKNENVTSVFRDTKRIRTPFDYDAQVFGSIASYLPGYAHMHNPDIRNQWRSEIACAIAMLSVAMYGRTLVLFTSREEMTDIYGRVRGVLEEFDIEPLLQNGASVTEIGIFNSVEQSVLFGVDRFWTGVDFPGATLSQVIVVRIPNRNFSDPLIKHRKKYRDREFYEKYYNPITRMRLRQGFGRLIRRKSDKGIFVVLDQRLDSPHFMSRHQSALPVRLRPILSGHVELADRGVRFLGLAPECKERGIDLTILERSISLHISPRG